MLLLWDLHVASWTNMITSENWKIENWKWTHDFAVRLALATDMGELCYYGEGEMLDCCSKKRGFSNLWDLAWGIKNPALECLCLVSFSVKKTHWPLSRERYFSLAANSSSLFEHMWQAALWLCGPISLIKQACLMSKPKEKQPAHLYGGCWPAPSMFG